MGLRRPPSSSKSSSGSKSSHADGLYGKLLVTKGHLVSFLAAAAAPTSPSACAAAGIPNSLCPGDLPEPFQLLLKGRGPAAGEWIGEVAAQGRVAVEGWGSGGAEGMGWGKLPPLLLLATASAAVVDGAEAIGVMAAAQATAAAAVASDGAGSLLKIALAATCSL